jgi:predicted Zn-dependent protease
MIDLIKAALKKNPEIKEWTISSTERSREELYLIFNRIESIRQAVSQDFVINIYIEQLSGDKKMTGTAVVNFNRTITAAELDHKLADAVFSAKLALNPYYQLSAKADNNLEYNNCDPKIALDPRAVLLDVQKTMAAKFENNPDVRCASAEIFVTLGNRSFYTSSGVEYKDPFSVVMMEAVILSGEGENEVESNLNAREMFLVNLDLENLLDRYIGYARDNGSAALPVSGKYPVIFTEEALSSFFNYYQSQASGRMLYNRMNKFKAGDLVVKDAKGDKLTLSYKPDLPGGTRTDKYDGYGTLLVEFTFIEDNVLKKIAADKKYADYLQCPVTGSQSNLVVKPGRLGYDELLEDGCLILSRFSTFIPSGVTGAFSGEIRNGLLFKNGKFTPVKGGSVTGMMDEACKAVWLSKEEIQKGNYYGPRYIKMADLDIAGA